MTPQPLFRMIFATFVIAALVVFISVLFPAASPTQAQQPSPTITARPTNNFNDLIWRAHNHHTKVIVTVKQTAKNLPYGTVGEIGDDFICIDSDPADNFNQQRPPVCVLTGEISSITVDMQTFQDFR